MITYIIKKSKLIPNLTRFYTDAGEIRKQKRYMKRKKVDKI